MKNRASESRSYEHMTVEELKTELLRLRENLRDAEDMHAFTFGRTAVHIGAEKAQNLQAEYEEECRDLGEKIRKIEILLKAKGAG